MNIEGENVAVPSSMSTVEETKQPGNDENKTAVSKSQAVPVVSGNKKEGRNLQKKTAIAAPVQQGKLDPAAELDRSVKTTDLDVTKKKMISSMRDDGLSEEDIKLLAEAFPEPIPPEDRQLTDADLQIKKERIAAALREDGLSEEDIELLSADLAETGGPLVENILRSAEEMKEEFLENMKEDGLSEEDIELLADALAVSEEGDGDDSADDPPMPEEEIEIP